MCKQGKAVRYAHPPTLVLCQYCLRGQFLCHTISFPEDKRHHHTHFHHCPNSFQPPVSKVPRNLANSVVKKTNSIHKIRFHRQIGQIKFKSFLENALKNALIAQSSDYVENSKNRHFPKEENLQCHTKTEENEKGANITQNRKNRK